MVAEIPLPVIKAIRIESFKREVSEYIHRHYDAAEQSSLNACMIEAMRKSPPWTNRQNLIASVQDWIWTVLDEYQARKADINAAANAAAVLAVTMNLAQFDSTDPRVSLKTVRDTRN